ncbi:hypothetical protein QWZ16_22270 [Vibrio ostreicida]|uniref:Uncharacterized protein n=1 Tax=Vibrio ostreicida TaxID=526588 RepID=A0ABT8BYT4_9VIBR|nr:hypothetical protein [Vibrio ostreicida]MDN3612326.1 hypothetical protein [Vibrio ostreicida]
MCHPCRTDVNRLNKMNYYHAPIVSSVNPSTAARVRFTMVGINIEGPNAAVLNAISLV